MMRGLGDIAVLERVNEARKRYPGATGFRFRDTRKGWSCVPSYGRAASQPASSSRALSWKQQQAELDSRLRDLRLKEIEATL